MPDIEIPKDQVRVVQPFRARSKIKAGALVRITENPKNGELLVEEIKPSDDASEAVIVLATSENAILVANQGTVSVSIPEDAPMYYPRSGDGDNG